MIHISLMEKWSLYFIGKEFTGNNLTLVNVRKNDTGDVLCIADNKIPSAVSHKFELTIHCKFFIHIVVFKSNYQNHLLK